MAESKVDILRRLREQNVTIKTRSVGITEKPGKFEELKKFIENPPHPEKKKRDPKPGPKNIPAAKPEKKKRGPYKKRKK